MKIGFHITTSKGFHYAINESIKYKANTFQFFPRNPRGSKSRKIKNDEISKFNEGLNKYNFGPVVCHGAYTMNLASNKESVRNNSIELMKDDFERIKKLGVENYVFHPGSHVGQGEKTGLDFIIEGLNSILDEDYKFTLCLETMSGKGTELGYDFKQLKYIMDNLNYKKVGICMDTCHIFSAGYNIKNKFSYVMEEFDNIIGINNIKILHFNDSKTEFNSRKDRHEKIGLGSLGIDTFKSFINYDYFTNIPIILETPNDLEGYKEEIELLYSLKE
ncbi:MAG: deoxyribonuclease IV [Miniphocaeibacter sp.]|uniref:deoxyribonuclease IV n=1 Tax=Miniphocaeibacter sp. TaxID=3100973 RepID=UPI0018253B78|nr:deoxyribonuclease IV [Gallicola sp.]